MQWLVRFCSAVLHVDFSGSFDYAHVGDAVLNPFKICGVAGLVAAWKIVTVVLVA